VHTLHAMVGTELPDREPPPDVWKPAHAAARGILAPIQRILRFEAASGFLLFIAAALALVWANSSFSASYFDLWHTDIGFHIGDFDIEHDLHFWINDGLMAIFFFVVGLEIRREIHSGELSSIRRAVLPIVAAIGGMVVPAAIYYAFNFDRPTENGWGIPMATDIAFALGVLTLLGARASASLRILLLAIAVIDDVGAILVIAFFYSSGIDPVGLSWAGGGIVLIFAMRRLGVRSAFAYILPAIAVWAGAYYGGIHPTIAGVVVGLLTPVKAWLGPERFVIEAREHVDGVHRAADAREILARLERLGRARKEVFAPVDRLLHVLHGWVAFGIMPLFALANAGVSLGDSTFDGDGWRVFVGIALGLVIGKVTGIFTFSWLTERIRVARLPNGVAWRGVGVVGLVGGIGFTMALFIAGLAMPPGPMLETAKLAVLCGSGLVIVIALVTGWTTLPLPASLASDRRERA
jgi:NhaA family Na+:H+ antiporter